MNLEKMLADADAELDSLDENIKNIGVLNNETTPIVVETLVKALKVVNQVLSKYNSENHKTEGV